MWFINRPWFETSALNSFASFSPLLDGEKPSSGEVSSLDEDHDVHAAFVGSERRRRRLPTVKILALVGLVVVLGACAALTAFFVRQEEMEEMEGGTYDMDELREKFKAVNLDLDEAFSNGFLEHALLSNGWKPKVSAGPNVTNTEHPDTTHSLAKRDVPPDQLCGKTNAAMWKGRYCDQSKAPRGWFDACSASAYYNEHYTGDCPSIEVCLPTRDSKGDAQRLCVPKLPTAGDRYQTKGQGRVIQWGYRSVTSDMSKNGPLTDPIQFSIPAKGDIQNAVAGAVFLDSTGTYILNPADHIILYPNGNPTRHLCESGDTSNQLKGRKEAYDLYCMPESTSARWSFAPNEHFIIKWTIHAGQTGMIFYVLAGGGFPERDTSR